MQFVKDIGLLEFSFISVFVVAYLLYMLRLILIAKKINTPFLPIIYKLILRTTYFTLLIVAALGPHLESSQSNKQIKSVAKDIFIALDLSLSMDASDVPPSRIERVKFELNKVIKEFASDRIGLIVFSSEAYVQCPLTFDKKSLSLFLDVTSTKLINNKGTDFFPPLNLALNKHLKITDSKESAKIILLISDGEDFSDKTEQIAEEIKDKKIKLFTLGVGTARGANIPNKNGKGIKKDREGLPVVTTLNSQPLKDLAKLTGGKYFEISDIKNDTERLINSINKIKGEVKNVDKSINAKSLRYHLFLIPALILMLIDCLFVLRVIKL